MCFGKDTTKTLPSVVDIRLPLVIQELLLKVLNLNLILPGDTRTFKEVWLKLAEYFGIKSRLKERKMNPF